MQTKFKAFDLIDCESYLVLKKVLNNYDTLPLSVICVKHAVHESGYQA